MESAQTSEEMDVMRLADLRELPVCSDEEASYYGKNVLGIDLRSKGSA